MHSLSPEVLIQNVEELAVRIGPRPVGSAANREAGETIATLFEAAGLTVERQTFDCPDWTDAGTTLTVNGHSFNAVANMWSRPCHVHAPVVPVCTLAELESAELDGRIVLLYGELTERPLAPRNYPLYRIERDQKIDALLEDKRAAAVLTVQHRRGLERIIEDLDLHVPSATIGPQEARALLKHPGERARLHIDTRLESASSAHIIGLKAGSRPQRVLICAHYDTKVGTPGAWDNASGAAVLMTLARALANEPLACSLEFLAFTDEEYLGNDSQVYLARRGETLGDLIGVINVDGVGHVLATTTITLAAGSPPLQAAGEAVTATYPGVLWVEPWPESSHSIFSFQGIPSFALSNRPYSPVYHLSEDTADWLDGGKLAEAANLAADLVRMLANRPVARAL